MWVIATPSPPPPPCPPFYGFHNVFRFLLTVLSRLCFRRNETAGVTFCGYECSASQIEYVSPTKLFCTLPAGAVGAGPVVVTTRSGGVGVCDVTFTYGEAVADDGPPIVIGRLEETDQWVDDPEDGPVASVHFQDMALADANPLKIDKAQMETIQLRGVNSKKRTAVEHNNFAGSEKISEKDFVPAKCLASIYKHATQLELSQALREYQHGVGSQIEETKEAMTKDIIKATPTTFAGSFEALHAIESKLGKDRKTVSGRTGGDLLITFEQRVQTVLKLAEDVFNPILDRQEKCDQNRNALSVLQNYEFLFNLPKRLGQSTKLKAWDHVIRDYQKARQLFEVTEVKLFADVEKGIEAIAAQVRDTLKQALCDLPTTVDKQLETISHLEQLGAKQGEPGWFCLEQQSELVVRELDKAADKLGSALELARIDQNDPIFGLSNSSVPSRTGSIEPNMSQATSTVSVHGDAAVEYGHVLENGTKLMELQSGAHLTTQDVRTKMAYAIEGTQGGGGGGSDAWGGQGKFPRLTFVEDISLVLTEHLPQLQRLGDEWITRSNDALDNNLPFEVHDAADVEAMVEVAVGMYVDYAREYLLGEDAALDADARWWLPRCEALIRSTRRTLKAMKLPAAAVAGLVELLVEVQEDTATALLCAAVEDVKDLVTEEDWVPVGEGKHTNLPVKFDGVMQSALSSLTDICSAAARFNGQVMEDPDVVESLICEAFESLTSCFQRLAFDVSVTQALSAPPSPTRGLSSRTPSRTPSRPGSVTGGRSRPGSATMGGGPRPLSAVSMSDSFVAQYDEDDKIPISAEKRLLCVMSNCLYVRRHLAPRIASRVSELGIGELDQAFDDTLRGLEDLDAQCFRGLLGQKGGLMSILIQEGEPKRFAKQSGSKRKKQVTAWETIPTAPREVRQYVKEVLLHMVVVHADVTACSRPFVTRVISALLVRISRDFKQMVGKISDFGENAVGAEQLLLEAHAMKSVLQAFDTSPSVWDPILVDLVSKLPPKCVAQTPGNSASPAGSPAAGRRRASRELPTLGQPATARRGGRGLPTPGGGVAAGGRSLPAPGRALPSLGGAKGGGKSLPSTGRALPAPNGAGRKSRRSLGGRGGGSRVLPKPGANATPPGSPVRTRRPSRQVTGAAASSPSSSVSSSHLTQSHFAAPTDVPTVFAPLLTQFNKMSAFQFACFLEAPESGQEISEETIDSFDRVDDHLDSDLIDEAALEAPPNDSSEDEFL